MLPPLPSVPGQSLAVRPSSPTISIFLAEQLPRDAAGATFDSRLYFDCLRKHHGGTLMRADQDLAGPLLSAQTAVWGAAILYAEVITSTQTLLDRCVCVCVCVCARPFVHATPQAAITHRRSAPPVLPTGTLGGCSNPTITATLPSGFVCLAAQQVSGRGTAAGHKASACPLCPHLPPFENHAGAGRSWNRPRGQYLGIIARLFTVLSGAPAQERIHRGVHSVHHGVGGGPRPSHSAPWLQRTTAPSSLSHHLIRSVVTMCSVVTELTTRLPRRGRPGASSLQALGLAIKWPNDIYSVDEAPGADGEAARRGRVLRKIGGILVNSSYIKDEFMLVAGARAW